MKNKLIQLKKLFETQETLNIKLRSKRQILEEKYKEENLELLNEAERTNELIINLKEDITANSLKGFELDKIKNFTGVSGEMTFDENGDVIKPIGFKTVKNGKFEWINK